MEFSRFEFLPDEVNLQFLNKLSYSDLINACQIPGLFHLCDWNFWKRKAEKDLNVPEWYFNLPLIQNRSVSGDQRFLEISSKFCISADSIARIENGKVEGIHNERTAKFLAIEQGNRHIFSLNKREDKRAELIDKLRRARVPDPNTYFKMSERELTSILNNMVLYSQTIRSGNIRLITENLNSDLPERASLLCGMLAATGNENTFPLVKEYLSRDVPTFSILNSSLVSHKTEQFIELFLSSGLVPNYIKDALIRTAYFTANIGCISFLENQGAQLGKEEKFKMLDKGYLYNPRPVEVYQIVQKLGSRKSTIPPLQGLESDIDIRILQIGDNVGFTGNQITTHDFIVPLVRHCLTSFKREGKIELLNILRKLCSEEGPEIKLNLFAEIGF